MNRCAFVLTAILLSTSSVVAEQLFLPEMEPPEKLEPEAPPEAEPEPAPKASLDWVENFVDPEGNAPEVNEEDLRNMVPALLSVERKVQYETACQYWLKLENRLPFKIRNLAVRFSAYIMGKGYDRPILFDTDIKSFSELRPTDSQYRDIFFEYAKCEDLDFIKVEDAGRCSVGGLTKFSTQSGDCARFIEVKESSDICVYLDTSMLELPADAGGRKRNEPPENPCGLIMQADIDILLEQFEVSYEEGDLENFVALFDRDAIINEGEGHETIERDYGGLFRESQKRTIEFKHYSWKPMRNGSAIIRFKADVVVDKGSSFGPDEYDVDGDMKVIKRQSGVFIASFLHEQKKGGGFSLPNLFSD